MAQLLVMYGNILADAGARTDADWRTVKALLKGGRFFSIRTTPAVVRVSCLPSWVFCLGQHHVYLHPPCEDEYFFLVMAKLDHRSGDYRCPCQCTWSNGKTATPPVARAGGSQMASQARARRDARASRARRQASRRPRANMTAPAALKCRTEAAQKGPPPGSDLD